MKNLFLFIALIIILGCSRNSQTTYNKDLKEPDKLVFNNLSNLSASDSILIDEVFDMVGCKIVGDSICILDRNRDNTILNIYSSKNSTKIQNGLKFGNGPDEFIVFNYATSCKSNQIAGYDIMRKSLYLYDVTSCPFIVSSEYKIPLDKDGRANPYTFISQYNDSIFLLKMDSMDNSEWHLADLKHNDILWKQTNRIRDTNESYTPFNYHQSINDSVLITCYKYMDLVELYNITTDSLTLIKSYGNLINQAKLEDYDELKYYYLGITSDNKSFYCLKSSDGSDFGTEIETYDISSLNPHYKYKIDKPVKSIIYDKTNRRLLGYSPQEDRTIFYIWKI